MKGLGFVLKTHELVQTPILKKRLDCFTLICLSAEQE